MPSRLRPWARAAQVGRGLPLAGGAAVEGPGAAPGAVVGGKRLAPAAGGSNGSGSLRAVATSLGLVLLLSPGPLPLAPVLLAQ